MYSEPQTSLAVGLGFAIGFEVLGRLGVAAAAI
jgi:hypothetical protein